MAHKSDKLLIPLVKAGGIHLLMFGLLLISFHSTTKEQPLEIQVRAAPVIKATAVSSEVVKKLVENKKKKIAAAKKAVQDRKNRIRRAADRKKKTAADKKRKAALDKKRKADTAEKKRKDDAAKKKKSDAADKKRKSDAEKKRLADAAEKKRKADAETKRLQKIANDRNAKLQAKANAAREQRVLTELQKYKALINNKISRNWIIGNQLGKCILEVKLAVGGLIIDVREVGGSPAICRTAKIAVYKSEPLPVPKSLDVFNKMRTLKLTLDPEDL